MSHPEPATPETAHLTCPCYACHLIRKSRGLPEPDRKDEECDPPGACALHGMCWTHSYWTGD